MKKEANRDKISSNKFKNLSFKIYSKSKLFCGFTNNLLVYIAVADEL